MTSSSFHFLAPPANSKQLYSRSRGAETSQLFTFANLGKTLFSQSSFSVKLNNQQKDNMLLLDVNNIF
jgi:hypothetical protein